MLDVQTCISDLVCNIPSRGVSNRYINMEVATLSNRRKALKTFCFILSLCAVFFIGWRVMPMVWPGIKETIVYPIFPQMKSAEPTPAPTQEPYVPESRTKAPFDATFSTSDSVIYYFYKDYCPWCRQLTPLTVALPASITLNNGTKSTVRLICLNKADEQSLQIIEAYYEMCNIPEEKQKVPSMVIGNRYLFGGEEIGEWLIEALIAGEGLDTPLLNGKERVP